MMNSEYCLTSLFQNPSRSFKTGLKTFYLTIQSHNNMELFIFNYLTNDTLK